MADADVQCVRRVLQRERNRLVRRHRRAAITDETNDNFAAHLLATDQVLPRASPYSDEEAECVLGGHGRTVRRRIGRG